MKIETSREKTVITLGKSYCFNHDRMIDVCIYLAAKDYWENYGKQQMVHYKNNKPVYRDYKRIKFALERFEGMSEKDIFDGVAYGYNTGSWQFGISRNEYRYVKTIKTLFELRGYMWN